MSNDNLYPPGSVPLPPTRLIHIADVGPGVRHLLYQSHHGATDVEVRHAVETLEGR